MTEVLNRALKTALAGKVGEPGDIQFVEAVPSCAHIASPLTVQLGVMAYSSPEPTTQPKRVKSMLKAGVFDVGNLNEL